MDLWLTVSVLVGGLLSFFSPCVIPLLPVYLGILTDVDIDQNKSVMVTRLIRTFLFVLGISFVFVLLGFGAGLFGGIFQQKAVRYGLGILIIVIGLHQMDLFKISHLYRQKRVEFQNLQQKNHYLKAFLLGVSLSFGWSPCIGPVLSSVLALVIAGGSSVYLGSFYMLIYSIGFAVPFILLTLFSNLLLKHVQALRKHMNSIKKIGGLLIVLMGILLIIGNLNIFH